MLYYLIYISYGCFLLFCGEEGIEFKSGKGVKWNHCNIQYNYFLFVDCGNGEIGYIVQNTRVKCGCRIYRTFNISNGEKRKASNVSSRFSPEQLN